MTFHPMPQPGPAAPWAFPVPERSVLGNGMTVVRCHRPGQKLVAVEVVLAAPLHAEPEGLDGVATIMARALTEGTGARGAEEFAAALERCGATIDAQADHPGVRVSLEVPASRLEQALELVAEALRDPAFAEPEIERTVANRLDEIEHELANPARRAAMALYAELFPAEDRISRPRQGSAETVRRIDRAAVVDFYSTHLRPAGATVVVVGDLTGIDLEPLLEGTLGRWKGEPGRPGALPAVTASDTTRVVIVHRPGSVQTQLLLGRIGPDRSDPVWPAQVVGTYCLGGTLTSRLDAVLREEKGYTYGVRAFAQPLRTTALLGISGSVATEVTAPALEDTFTVLRTLAAEGLTDEERDAAVQNLVGVAPLKFETAAVVADTFADQIEQGLPDDYQAELYLRIAEASTREASDAVVAAFVPERLVVALVGDADQIAEPVRALGIGEVRVIGG
ncbi:M16 family metallopeptidase [Allostreptomyces psammosilenae]|nr:pitrilysin family protein [Allostreptomyces psammosilenae]